MADGKKDKKGEWKKKAITELKEHWMRDILLVFGGMWFAGLLGQALRLPIAAAKMRENGFDGKVSEIVRECFSANPIHCIIASVSTVSGFLCLLLTICLMWLGWFYGIKPRIKEKTGYKDDRNFTIAEEGTYGTSALMREEEIEDVLDVRDIKDIDSQEGIILGQLNGKVLSVPSDKEFDEKVKRLNWGIEEIINNKLNKNVLVIGAPGTMKTRAVVRNSIIQAAKRNESLVITDPKGELVEDTAKYLENQGYNVRIFNLVNLMNSDSWNCVASIGNNSLVAKIFADAVADNAGKGNDTYFVTNAAIILKAVSLYVIESPHEEKKTMGRVYDILSEKTPEQMDELFFELPEKSVARRAYNAFRRCNDNVKGQILNNVSAMLSVFQDDAVRDVTNTDEIDIEEICYKKSAFFLITSDQHTSFDFLAVLFYAMSFIKQVEFIDKERGKKEAGLEYKETLPINYIMDEFSNLGQIPDFSKKISTVRSRNINITIIIQNIAQLKNRYPNDQWQEIMGCCDIKIFLGCTDMMTAEYISETTGIATIEVESTNSKYDRQVMIFNQDTDYHEVKSRGQRKVMNKDEVLRMKNTDELLLLRCQKPILCKKFDYTLHPESKKFIKSSPADHIPKWRAEKMQEEAENRAKAEQLLQNAAKRKEEELAYVKYTKTTRTSSASVATNPASAVEPATSVATAKAETSSVSSTAKAANASKTSEVQGVQNKSAKKSNEQAKTEAFIDGIDFDLFSEENSKAEEVKEADASTSQLGQSNQPSQPSQPSQDFWSDEDIEERNIETDSESDDYDEDDEDEYEYCA